MTVTVGIGPVSFGDVVAVAREDAQVVLSEESAAAIDASRETIEALANDPTPVYGVSTGFGALATRHIPKESRTQLQRSLIRSHAAGSGPEVEVEVVRALMLLRLSTLTTGRTGVREIVMQTYADLLTAGRRVRAKSDLALMLRGEQYTGVEYVSDSDARAIEVHVANLRRKLGESPASPRWIETVRGVGYRLTAS